MKNKIYTALCSKPGDVLLVVSTVLAVLSLVCLVFVLSISYLDTLLDEPQKEQIAIGLFNSSVMSFSSVVCVFSIGSPVFWVCFALLVVSVGAHWYCRWIRRIVGAFDLFGVIGKRSENPYKEPWVDAKSIGSLGDENYLASFFLTAALTPKNIFNAIERTYILAPVL